MRMEKTDNPFFFALSCVCEETAGRSSRAKSTVIREENVD